jgi:hypothetical protein
MLRPVMLKFDIVTSKDEIFIKAASTINHIAQPSPIPNKLNAAGETSSKMSQARRALAKSQSVHPSNCSRTPPNCASSSPVRE